MDSKSITRMLIIFMALIVIALIMGVSIKTNREADAKIKAADEIIESYEGKDYEKNKKILQQNRNSSLLETETEESKKQAEIYVTQLVETYCDPTTAEYEPITYGLSEYEFYEAYSSMEARTWDDCVVAAVNQFGMDEYTLRICAGWLVNEDYTYYDAYLSYLCCNCPWYYYSNGYSVADGLAGWDYTGMYSEDRLVCLSYYISQEELQILYLAITHPYYNIYGCDGLSWYGSGCIYESYCNGYDIRVWAY